jgi:hypothetical protein
MSTLDVIVEVLQFTPEWAGVWYYADGSGSPPEPAEANIGRVWAVTPRECFGIKWDDVRQVPDSIVAWLLEDDSADSLHEAVCAELSRLEGEAEAAAERAIDKMTGGY